MQPSFDFMALIAAAVCFGLSTAGVPSSINLQSLGLLFWVLTVLI